jgi:signal transduction histidine kinase
VESACDLNRNQGNKVRRRIFFTTLTTVFITALLIEIPLLGYTNYGIRQKVKAFAASEAQDDAQVVDYRIKARLPVDKESLRPYLERQRLTVVTFPNGELQTFGDQPQKSYERGVGNSGGVTVVITAPIDSFVSLAAVAVRVSAIIIFASLIGLLIAIRRSRMLTSVLVNLAKDAASIGSGDLRPARRYGMADLDQVADSLDSSSIRVAELLRAERGLVADVTHQLRTPLTAIELQLDEVIDAANRSDYAAARLGVNAAHEQVYRLRDVISDLLTAARQSEIGEAETDLAFVLSQQETEWRPLFTRANRRIDVSTPAITVRGGDGPLRQIFTTLFDNALVHGQGTVTVRVRDTAGLVVVEISDEGSGLTPELAKSMFERNISGAGSSGLGLSVARALIENLGGRLELINTRPTTFALFLIQRDQDASDLESDDHTIGEVSDGGVESSTSAASTVSGNTQRR